MDAVIIAVTFFLGVALAIVAIIALFKGHAQGQGSFKIPGFEFSGTGAPVLFLFVAAVLVLTGFGFASSKKEVAKKETQVVACSTDKASVTEEAARLDASLKQQVEFNQALQFRLSPATLESVKAAKPEFRNLQIYKPSARLAGEISRIPPQP